MTAGERLASALNQGGLHRCPVSPQKRQPLSELFLGRRSTFRGREGAQRGERHEVAWYDLESPRERVVRLSALGVFQPDRAKRTPGIGAGLVRIDVAGPFERQLASELTLGSRLIAPRESDEPEQ